MINKGNEMIAPLDPRKDPMLSATEKKPTIELKRVQELVDQFAVGYITCQQLWDILESQTEADAIPLRNRISGFDTEVGI